MFKKLAIIALVVYLIPFANADGFLKITSENDLTNLLAKEQGVVVVDFYADWCPSCGVVKKSLKDIKNNVGDKVIFSVVDFAKNQELAKKYNIQSVPNVLFFKNGKLVYKLANLCTTNDYSSAISDIIKNGAVNSDFIPEKKMNSMNITAKQSKVLIDNSNAIILDVRTKYEYNNGHIANTMHIPLNSIQSRLNELKQYKDSNIVVYCLSGYRSGLACDFLVQKGYKVFNMEYGIGGWKRAGFKLVQ